VHALHTSLLPLPQAATREKRPELLMPGSYEAMSKPPHGESVLQGMTGESEHTLLVSIGEKASLYWLIALLEEILKSLRMSL